MQKLDMCIGLSSTRAGLWKGIVASFNSLLLRSCSQFHLIQVFSACSTLFGCSFRILHARVCPLYARYLCVYLRIYYIQWYGHEILLHAWTYFRLLGLLVAHQSDADRLE